MLEARWGIGDNTIIPCAPLALFILIVRKI